MGPAIVQSSRWLNGIARKPLQSLAISRTYLPLNRREAIVSSPAEAQHGPKFRA